MYEFHNPGPNAPVFVLAELPPRYAISFVPAVSALPVTASPAVPVIAVSVPSVSCVTSTATVSSIDYSVVSSANFVLPTVSATSASISSSSSSSCIGPSR